MISDWYDKFWGMDEGGVIILAGGCGCGKTHIATNIYNSYQAGGAELITEPDLFARLLGSKNDGGFVNHLRQARPLIIDDIGTHHVRPETMTYIHEKYWWLFDKRSKPLLITTNLEQPIFSEWIGERATSRLFEQMNHYGGGFVDLFKVPDYRKVGLQWAA